MKKLSTILIVFLFSIQFAAAQAADSTALPSRHPKYDLYMQKHRTNNTIAWLLLSGGVTAMVVGVGDGLSSIGDIGSPSYNSHAGETINTIGVVMGLGSIPFFIIGHIDKSKARLSLKNESMAIGGNKLKYPAISLKIQF